MCRSIKTLRAEPDWTSDDAHAAALQYVRKISGYRVPSQKNAGVFNQAVENIATATRDLLKSIT